MGSDAEVFVFPSDPLESGGSNFAQLPGSEQLISHRAQGLLDGVMGRDGTPANNKPMHLGVSISSALHSTLQQELAEEQNDPLILALQRDHPDEYMKHEHAIHQADLAVQSLSALFAAFEQQQPR